MSQRIAWTQPLTVISDIPTPATIVYQPSESLPALSSVVKSTTATWCQQNGQQQLPRPPPVATNSIRSRPLSAGSAAMSSRRVQSAASSSPPVQHRSKQYIIILSLLMPFKISCADNNIISLFLKNKSLIVTSKYY